jgi:hypothetical protein
MRWYDGFRTLEEAQKQAMIIARQYKNRPAVSQTCSKPKA